MRKTVVGQPLIAAALALAATAAASAAPETTAAQPPAPVATPEAGEGLGPVSLPNTEVRSLRSEVLGIDFRLLVARPFRPAAKLPVIYLLDADISFPLVRQTAMSLASGFELPPVLIVGIGYGGGMMEGMKRRTLDYTPTVDPTFVEFAAKMGAAAPGGKAAGGAEPFLRFVRKELKPFVEANYPVDPTDATLLGVSFGGLFGAYTLFHHPDTFQRYILGSPSLWWDDRVVFDYEERYARQHDDLQAHVFVAAGGHETADHDEAALARMPTPMRRLMLEMQKEMGGGMQMVEVLEPFVDKLRSRDYPGLDLELVIFPGETHGSVPPMAVSRGLRTVFGTLSR